MLVPMQDARNALFEKLYLEHRAHARHIETLLSCMLGTISAVGGAVLAFAASDEITRSDWPLGLIVVAFGLFGGLFAVKLHEKLRLEMKLADAALTVWEESTGASPATGLHAGVKAAHAARHPIMDRIKMFWLWLTLATLLSFAGLVLTIVALLPS